MIPEEYVVLLSLPPETDTGEARRHCEQLLERLGQNIEALPSNHPNRQELDTRKADLNKALSFLEKQNQSAASTEATSNPATLPPASGYSTAHLEELIDQGMRCLCKNPLDPTDAAKYYVAAARETAGKTIPEPLKNLLGEFKKALEQVKREVLRAKIASTLKRVTALLAHQPPAVAEAREKLGLVASALRQSPDAFLQADFENLRKTFQELEKRTAHSRVEEMRRGSTDFLSKVSPPALAPEHDTTEWPAPADAQIQTPPVSTPQPAASVAQVNSITITGVAEDSLEAATSETAPAVPHAVESGGTELFVRLLEQDNEVQSTDPSGQDDVHQEPVPVEISEITPEQSLVHEEPSPEHAVLPVDESATCEEASSVAARLISRTASLPPSDNDEHPARSRMLSPALAVIAGVAILAIVCLGYIMAKWAHKSSRSEQTVSRVVRPAPPVSTTAPPVAVQPPPAPAPVAPPPPLVDTGELTITVIPATADLFTNGVSLRHPHYPVVLRGESEREISIVASLAGYSNKSGTFIFPSRGAQMSQTIELQPRLAVLIVQSDPPATEVLLQRPGGNRVKVKIPRTGIEITPGVALDVTIDLPNYETATVSVPALKPGDRHEVAFGKLISDGAKLIVKADPPDARFSVIYSGQEPISLGSVGHIDGITPKLEFLVVAERAGYASQTNHFTLKSNEVRECNFGKLKPLPGELIVTAAPQPFDLKIGWDAYTKDFGNSGKAMDLPVRKNLALTVSAPGRQTLSTNIILEPGETRMLALGTLDSIRGSIVLKSPDIDGAEVIYGIDASAPIQLGATNRITGVPFGSAVVVTLHKTGYTDRTMEIRKLTRAIETLDFGRLTPASGNAAMMASTSTVIAAPTTIPPVPAEVDQTLRQIATNADNVRSRVPLTEVSRHTWLDWLNQIETRYKDDAQAWMRLKGPVDQMRELVNATRPILRVPNMGASMRQ